MRPDLWRQIERLYHATLEKAPDERASFLDEACAGNEELRREVSELLAHDEEGADFIEDSALKIAARALASQSVEIDGAETGALRPSDPGSRSDTLSNGHTIRNFRVIRKIAQGGMGQVYEADDLTLGRRVAIKLLHTGVGASEPARQRLLREARAASILNHPNIVTVHSIEEADGLDFIVMELVEGETLKEWIARGPLELETWFCVAVQVAEAVALAHSAGIVHRDLKPSNILMTPRRKAKVLDFGLAERTPLPIDHGCPGPADSAEAGPGAWIIGSTAYMSPEQTRGEPLDARSDVFSLGSVLYEAATGVQPFQGAGTAQLFRAIAETEPPPPSSLNPRIPPPLDSIVACCLQKKREERYESAEALAIELRQLEAWEDRKTGLPAGALSGGRNPRLVWGVGVTLLIVLGAAAWWYGAYRNQQWARDAIPEMEDLIRREAYFEAYTTASRASRYLPHDPNLSRLLPVVTDDLTVSSDPPGASVYLKRLVIGDPEQSSRRTLIGVTPIPHLEVPRAEYVVEVELQGFAPWKRTLSSSLDRVQKAILGPPDLPREVRLVQGSSGEDAIRFNAYSPLRIEASLKPVGEAPPKMVFVPGGDYRLMGYGRPTSENVTLEDFYLDQFEVTNREYAEFIAAGGYQRPEYWKHSFLEAGRTLDWAQAMDRLRDKSGLPGPQNWIGQSFPTGREDHPVTGISWYEAAAYAEFRGKQLPTLFHWEKAARDGAFTLAHGFIMPWGLNRSSDGLPDRVNLQGSDSVPVDSLEFGMSPYGAYQMAGNVSEWLLNGRGDGFTTAGGSWKDPVYGFASFGTLSGFHRDDALGFRCALYPTVPSGRATSAVEPGVSAALPPKVDRATHEAMLRFFQYDRLPLEAEVEEVVETSQWRREKISFAGTGGQRALAYLYLPKHGVKPFQVIHYLPSDGVFYGLSVPLEVEAHASPYIQAGRAVFAIVLEGYRERSWPNDYQPPSMSSVRFRDQVAAWAIDLQRGLDYLIGREEIDPTRIAGFAVSVNNRKLALLALEKRHRSLVLLSAGVLRSFRDMIPETNGLYYAPFIEVPKLMVHGLYDDVIPFNAEAAPLFDLLPQPKELFLFDHGHIPPIEISVPVISRWLDRTLGPIQE